MPRLSIRTSALALMLSLAAAGSAHAQTGAVTTFAGNGQRGTPVDGAPATTQPLTDPWSVASLTDGTRLVAETFSNRIQAVAPNGVISRWPTPGATFNAPAQLIRLRSGDVLIATYGNQVLRWSATTRTISVFAAGVSLPTGMAEMPDGSILVATYRGTHQVRRYSAGGGSFTIFAGTGTAGSTGDGGPATAATLNGPFGVAAAPDGRVAITEHDGNRVRLVGTNGIISTLTGQGGGYVDGVPASQSTTGNPAGAFYTDDGSLIFGEIGTSNVRRIRPDGIITRLATANRVYGVNPGLNGAVLFADTNNSLARSVDAGLQTGGPPPSADLAASVSASPTAVRRGETVDLTATARNLGPNDAAGVALTIPLPAGTAVVANGGCTLNGPATQLSCAIGALANGASVTRTPRLRVTDAAPNPLTLSASVAGTSPADPVAANNTASTPVGVSSVADLSIVKTADRATAPGGSTVTYTLAVRNDGPSTAVAATVSDPVPGGLRVLSAGPGCTTAGQNVTCALGDLPSGATRMLTVTAAAETLDPLTDHVHAIDTARAEEQVTLDAGQTREVRAACPAGLRAADASVRVDAVNQGHGSSADILVPALVRDGEGAYRATVRNPTTSDNVQGKLFVHCVAARTGDERGHAHDLAVGAPQTASAVLGGGRSTLDVACGAGQAPVAPEWTTTGTARVVSSARTAAGWRFIADGVAGSTVTASVSCLALRTGAAAGHVHELGLRAVTRTVTVPGGGEPVTARVECDPLEKGLVGSVDPDAGVLSLGHEPQARQHDVRLVNPFPEAREARIGLLCLGDRSGVRITDFANTASVSSPTPDADSGDRVSTATVRYDADTPPVTAAAPPAAPAPTAARTAADPAPAAAPATAASTVPDAAPGGLARPIGRVTLSRSTLGVPVTCSSACSGTAVLSSPRTGVIARAGYRVLRGRTVVKVRLSTRTAARLRKLRVTRIDVRLGGRTTRLTLTR